jgi:transcriptional regulator with XRE-family HTH domain
MPSDNRLPSKVSIDMHWPARATRRAIREDTRAHQVDAKLPRAPELSGASNYGAQAKSQRMRRKMTLGEVAELSGLSKGHISRFERGEKSLSIAALMRLSHALNTSVATLLGERIDEEAIHLVRATDRKMRKAKEKGVAYQFARLSGRERAAPVEAFVVEVSNTSAMSRAAHHAGEEIFFVLDGVIELELADRTFRLAKGDYLQFSGSLKHKLRGVQRRSSVLVVIVGDRNAKRKI